MSEQALGAAQSGSPSHEPTSTLDEPSIADEILDLDAFLAGDIRRAERIHRFATRPDLEARIDELEAELDTLTDDRGRPLDAGEKPVGGATGRTAVVVAKEIEAVRVEYAASFRGIRLRQMEDEPYREWRDRHAEQLDKPLNKQPTEMWDELVASTAIEPAITVEQAAVLRQKMGTAPFEALALVAWQVNRSQGVSVPKSPLSSAVLSTQTHEQS